METFKKYRWWILGFAILALVIIAWFVYKSIPHEQGGGAPPVTTTTTTPGALELATGFLSGGWLGSIFGGGKDKVKCVSGCDQNKYGYDCDGFLDPNCGAGRTQQ